MKFWTAAVFIGVFGLVQCFNNVNVDRTCSISSNCLGCMSRTSPDLERCLQLFFYITYTTTGNQREIDRYCNGDCPLVLATANHYCGGDDDTNELLKLCPSYSYVPTGSFNVKYNTSCTSSTAGRCYHCLGNDNQEAVRCLQLYFLATAANHTSVYDSRYCEGNCPSVLSSFGWYCGNTQLSTQAYSYCQRTEREYCGHLSNLFGSELTEGASNCASNCSSAACALAINEYGCCLRQNMGSTCSNIPRCNLPVEVATRDFKVDDQCPVVSCSPCLARESNKLERCEQLYTYLSYVATSEDAGETNQATDKTSNMQQFCSGECPILLSTSNFFCGGFTATRPTTSHSLCPSYDVVPSASVDIMANYGRSRTCSIRETCAECLSIRSPEATRCQQLYSLTFHPNMSNYYLNIYCSSNCPLTLGTAGWYCDSISPLGAFDRCMRRNDSTSTDFCAELINRDIDSYNSAVQSCIADCTTTACALAKNLYGCCLNMNTVVASNCNIQDCAIMTAGAPPVLATPLMIAVLIALVCYFIN